MDATPIACRLTPEELRRAAGELLPGLLRSARTVAAADAALRLTLDPTDGSIRRIASVIERERRCCPFLDFVLEIPAAADSVTLTVSGPDGTSELFRTLAAELDRGPATSAG
ncbi:MAG TPA: hypothetical protein VFW04_09765 [Gemmatimonadaceae bacterium]|nr:hypothetical protein [Gemmatimonadaceae bacterium]